jgi:hypothetical protein
MMCFLPYVLRVVAMLFLLGTLSMSTLYTASCRARQYQHTNKESTDSLLNLSVLLYIPQDFALREIPYIVTEEGKGYCAGSKLMLSLGPAYTAALRIAIGNVMRKIHYTNVMPIKAHLETARYDAMIEPVADVEKVSTGIDFHSSSSSANSTSFGISTSGASGMGASGRIYRFVTNIEPKISLRITLRSGETFVIRAPHCKATGDETGECIQLGEAMLRTINRLRTPMVNAFVPLLQENFASITPAAK